MCLFVRKKLIANIFGKLHSNFDEKKNDKRVNTYLGGANLCKLSELLINLSKFLTICEKVGLWALSFFQQSSIK